MENTKLGWTDEKVEGIIGNLLRLGVMIAGSVVFGGALVYLIRHGSEVPNYQVFRGEPTDLTTLGGIWRQTLTGHGRGLIQLGLLLLVATPIARVAFSLFAFARQRDLLYVLITALVLSVLLYSLLAGRG